MEQGTKIPLIAQYAIASNLKNSNHSSQSPSGFALQPLSTNKATSCTIRASPFYLYTKQQITAYVRFQGCQIIRTTSPTTVKFFRTDASPIYTDSNMQSSIFPLDGTFRTGSVIIDSLDNIRSSTESYNAILSVLELD
jgi:hypothetical protein